MNDVVKNEKWYGGNRSMEDLWDGNSGKMTGGAPTFSQGDGMFLLKKYTAYFVNATMPIIWGIRKVKQTICVLCVFQKYC